MQLQLSIFYTQTVFLQPAGYFETGHPPCEILVICYKKNRGGSVPHHINVDPNPCFHFIADADPTFHFNADPDQAPHQCNANLRQQPSIALYSMALHDSI
jgi:hypothetical protein